MTPGWALAIVIPARDEERSIGACLRAIVREATAAGLPFDITVVADRCTDATAEVAAAAVGGRGRVLEVDHGNVGAGRRVGTAWSLGALAGHAPERTWILSTDADSVVPAGWVQTHLRLADAGAHGVAGLVSVGSFAEHPAPVEAAFQRRYELGAAGRHPHVHGTNLGVRADAYRTAGGWRDRATGEDHDLWDRLRSTGAVLVPTIDAPVLTSGRRCGRAPDGFAALLCSLAAEETS